MRSAPNSNAGPMADIAFTLLIFFLVSTTLATDKGERVRLPEFKKCEESECDFIYSDWNVLTIDLLSNGEVYLEDELFLREQLPKEVKTFLLNNKQNPKYSDSYEEAVVLYSVSDKAGYEDYLAVYSLTKNAFTQIRNQASKENFGRQFEELNNDEAIQIRKKFPLKLVEQTVIEK